MEDRIVIDPNRGRNRNRLGRQPLRRRRQAGHVGRPDHRPAAVHPRSPAPIAQVRAFAASRVGGAAGFTRAPRAEAEATEDLALADVATTTQQAQAQDQGRGRQTQPIHERSPVESSPLPDVKRAWKRTRTPDIFFAAVGKALSAP